MLNINSIEFKNYNRIKNLKLNKDKKLYILS